MFKKINRFLFHIPFQDKLLFLEALVLQTGIKILLLVIPFKHYKKWFASKSDFANSLQTASPTMVGDKIRQIKKAVSRANRILNWHNRCLVMSLSAKKMLNRRQIKSDLHLGLQLNEQKKLLAHAWIEAQQIELVEKEGNYTVVFTF